MSLGFYWCSLFLIEQHGKTHWLWSIGCLLSLWSFNQWSKEQPRVNPDRGFLFDSNKVGLAAIVDIYECFLVLSFTLF